MGQSHPVLQGLTPSALDSQGNAGCSTPHPHPQAGVGSKSEEEEGLSLSPWDPISLLTLSHPYQTSTAVPTAPCTSLVLSLIVNQGHHSLKMEPSLKVSCLRTATMSLPVTTVILAP